MFLLIAILKINIFERHDIFRTKRLQSLWYAGLRCIKHFYLIHLFKTDNLCKMRHPFSLPSQDIWGISQVNSTCWITANPTFSYKPNTKTKTTSSLSNHQAYDFWWLHLDHEFTIPYKGKYNLTRSHQPSRL